MKQLGITLIFVSLLCTTVGVFSFYLGYQQGFLFGVSHEQQTTEDDCMSIRVFRTHEKQWFCEEIQ